MYSRTILKIIGLFLLTFTCQNTMAAPPSPIKISTVKQLNSLKSKLSSEKQLIKKLHQVNGFIKNIKELRSRHGRQSELEEVFLDRLIDGLKSLPEAKEFKLENCRNYKANMLFQFDPRQEDEPKEPGTKEAFEILTILCSKGSTK